SNYFRIDLSRLHPEDAFDFPLAVAVRELDRLLDQEKVRETRTPHQLQADIKQLGYHEVLWPKESDDCPVEQRLGSALLQQAYHRRGDLQFAEYIGGSAFESFLLNSDWHSPGHNGIDGINVGTYENYVNRTYHQLMNLPTATGTRFRAVNRPEILRIARDAVREDYFVSSTLSHDLDFLFLDRTWTDTEPSLAMDYWSYLDKRLKSTPNHSQREALQLRWEYLSRLWPESKPEMFAPPLNEALARSDYLDVPPLNNPALTADDRFVILTSVADTARQQLERLPADTTDDYDSPRAHRARIVEQLQTQAEHLPCEAAAALVLEKLLADPKHVWWSRLHGILSRRPHHTALVRLSAESQNAELQKIVLKAIRENPVRGYRELLPLFLQAEDEGVRELALETQAALEELAAWQPSLRTEKPRQGLSPTP
ncbi:MAG: hypothetical protein KDA85_20530, partial [Planctomycetaceae bacterium]|nr:hypothetical protein [Planctomycetaceae bacterium]